MYIQINKWLKSYFWNVLNLFLFFVFFPVVWFFVCFLELKTLTSVYRKKGKKKKNLESILTLKVIFHVFEMSQKS